MDFLRMQGESKRKTLWLIVLIQLLLIGSVAGVYQFAVTYGEPVWVKTEPYDPANPFYGSYYDLNYSISRANRTLWKDPRKDAYGVKVQVALREKQLETIFRTEEVNTAIPAGTLPGRFLLKGKVHDLQTNVPEPAPSVQAGENRAVPSTSFVEAKMLPLYEVFYPISRVEMSKWKSPNAVKYNQEVFVTLKPTAEGNGLEVVRVSGEHPLALEDGMILTRARVTNYAAEEFAPIDLHYPFSIVSQPAGEKPFKGDQDVYVTLQPVADRSVEIAGIYEKRPADVPENSFLTDAVMSDDGQQLSLTYGFEQYFVNTRTASEHPNPSGDAWVEARIAPWGQIIAVNIRYETPETMQE